MSALKKGPAVLKRERPAHDELHRKMLARDGVWSWTILDDHTFAVVEEEGGAESIMTLAEVKAWLGMAEPAKCSKPRAIAAVPSIQEAPKMTSTPRPAGLPTEITDWLDKLVFEGKRDYATAYALHLIHGASCPDDPGADWAAKARRKIEGLAGGRKRHLHAVA